MDSFPPPENKLPGLVLVLWRLHCLGGAALLLGAVALGRHLWPNLLTNWVAVAAIGLATVSIALELLLITRLRHRYYRYQTASDALSIRTGCLFAKHLVIPASQVLYVDVQQGPLARRWGLCKVNIGTLGSVHPLGPIEAFAAKRIADQFGTKRRSDEQK